MNGFLFFLRGGVASCAPDGPFRKRLASRARPPFARKLAEGLGALASEGVHVHGTVRASNAGARAGGDVVMA
jgi:hypothetical protein